MRLIRCLIVLLSIILTVFYSAGALAYTHQLNSVTAQQLGGQWQLKLQLTGSGPLKYQYFSLQGPSRLVIDIDNTQRLVDTSTLSLSHSPVFRVRAAYHNSQTLRIVLDLRYPLKATVRALTLNNQEQLLVTLTGPQVAALSAPHKLIKPKPIPVADSVKRSKDVIVVIDPGHGGKDPGATGVKGTHEKNVVLGISKILYQLINKQPGFKAYLTRNGDYYLTLRQRLAIARKDKADMFVAIHADAFRNKSAKGVSVYALSSKGATSEAARWLAERENQSELIGGVDLSDKTQMLQSVLISLSQTATIRSSLELGEAIISSLESFASLHDDQVDQAAFVVLKSPDIPSLLIETGFLSNPQEEMRLRTYAYQYKVAQAINHGIVGYFEAQPPRSTTLALEQQWRREGLLHTVHRGDTLSYIAFRYHISVASLRSVNHLQSDVIHVGQVLRIPPKTTG